MPLHPSSKCTRKFCTLLMIDSLMWCVTMQLGEAEGWLREEDRKQKSLKPSDNPSLLSSAIDERIETLRKPFTRLKNKKKPKPPPSPKSDGKSNETEPEEAASKPDPLADEARLEEEPFLDGEEDFSGRNYCLYVESRYES